MAPTKRLAAIGLTVLLAAGALVGAAPAEAREAHADGVVVGQPWTGERGVPETTAAIMARSRSVDAAGPRTARVLPEVEQPDRRRLPQDPSSPAAPQGPAPSVAARGPSVAQTVGTTFTGATLDDTAAFPPDSMGAVGPTQYIVAVNGRIRSFDKSTGLADGVLNASTDAFFASVSNGAGTSDPRIRYDRTTARWYTTIINVALPNRVLIAVSDTSTITGSSVWTFFFFQQEQVSPAGNSTCLADYPTLGVDAAALYIGVNEFCGANINALTFDSTAGFVVRKSSIQGTDPIVVTAFRGLVASPTSEGPYTPQGVDNPAPTSAEGYFIGVSSTAFGRLVLRRVGDPGGTPTIGPNVLRSVPATAFPFPVDHLGNTGGPNGKLDGLDDRLMNAVLRNGHLWTIHNIGVNSSGTASSPNRDATRWYDLTGIPTGSTPTVNQSGTVFDSSLPNNTTQLNYFMGSIMVSGQGHVATGGTVAGTLHRADAYTTGRLATDATGTMAAPTAYTATTFAYNPPADPGGSGGRRWGDYSSTTLDPNDDMTMWTIQEFTSANDKYGVRVAKLSAPPPATPASTTPSTVPTGQASTDVMITGTSSAGSGFFDPGAGFANRLQAAFGGGVTVNSVTFTDATHMTANISTVSASAGSHSVTVTNPDGQQATTPALLTVTDPGPATHFSVTAPASATAGTPFSVTVTALDASNTTAAGYTGTVHLTSSSAGTLPADYTFLAGDAGSHTFSGTLTTVGSQTVTATDTVTPSINGTSSPISVSAPSGGGGGGGGPAPAAKTVTRLAGSDRITTAIAVSGDSFPDRADAVVLARADQFPDALVGTPLAVAKNGPLLLTGSATLDPRTQTEIDRVLGSSGTVYLLGGTTALSPSVATALSSGGHTVVRLAGPDRAATAVAVADQGLENRSLVFEATGLGFADAVTAGAAAAKAGAAVLLTNGSTQAPATASYLAAHPEIGRTAIGGPAAAADPSATPIVGSDRYDTAVKVATAFFTNPTTVGVASGTNFPDALAGGAHIGKRGGPLLLTDPSSLPAVTQTYLDANRAGITAGYVYGGTGAVSGSTLNQIKTAVGA